MQRCFNPERSNELVDFALLASWPTPTSPVVTDGHEAGNNRFVTKTVGLASWVSPTAQDHSRGGKEARPHDTPAVDVDLHLHRTDKARPVPANCETVNRIINAFEKVRGRRAIAGGGLVAFAEQVFDPPVQLDVLAQREGQARVGQDIAVQPPARRRRIEAVAHRGHRRAGGHGAVS